MSSRPNSFPGCTLISVVIPTFNRSKFLDEAVRSVLRQKDVPQEYEIIVVDDGSTEDIRQTLANLPAPVRYLRQDHSGVSAARNLGISNARGEWIAFLDSDDLWFPGKLSAQMRYFSQNPGMLLCQTEEIWIRNGKRFNPKKYHKKPQGYCFPLLLERCLVSPSAVVIHRSIFESVGMFDESFPACEDYDLWLRIGHRFPLGLLEKPLTIKRGGHPDQLSASVPALDQYRIISIANLLRNVSLDAGQIRAASEILRIKAEIYAAGCRKRGKADEAQRVEEFADMVLRNRPAAASLADEKPQPQ
ncbi:MAG: glycosyltransferase family 2 protein [Syntrophobacteraceae bacterium]